ncbi:hypothetical protein BpHYR1_032018 [Brachionus plicatilis]|uniref:Uncharacterized protein n=1 Tax=Brachionus plicatilis TaxID=10195 RepID=A0A3M7T1V3_BRAPC|nr:hypothetical protein BpHYR1_032018 [Brachionus plicatilis]
MKSNRFHYHKKIIKFCNVMYVETNTLENYVIFLNFILIHEIYFWSLNFTQQFLDNLVEHFALVANSNKF